MGQRVDAAHNESDADHLHGEHERTFCKLTPLLFFFFFNDAKLMAEGNEDDENDPGSATTDSIPAEWAVLDLHVS